MRYILCCPICGCKDLEQDIKSHYVCDNCGEVNEFIDLDCEEE